MHLTAVFHSKTPYVRSITCTKKEDCEYSSCVALMSSVFTLSIFSEIFGLSNFAAWEVCGDPAVCAFPWSDKPYVVKVVGICKTNDYVLPKIYQV